MTLSNQTELATPQTHPRPGREGREKERERGREREREIMRDRERKERGGKRDV